MTMRAGTVVASALLLATPSWAQDLGPHFRKIADGIYVQTAREVNSNVGIILTSDGVVLIDSGQTPIDTREVAEVVKKLTPLPVKYIIDTEVHPDHTTGHFVFSPPAIVVNHQGAGDAMRKAENPNRSQTLAAQSPEMAQASQGYRLVVPHIEYQQKMTLRVGERTLELMHLKNAHSEADTAVWLPAERVLFASSVAIPNSLNNVRAFVTIPEMLAATRMLRSLNPAAVIPGHGSFGTTAIFDASEKYYTLLVERVRAMVMQGRTRDEITKELKMPESASWAYQDRWPSNVDAAYRAATQK
ncbi:MAG: MBL fold metallo-hydrolase [Vicinamibacterales bacterium]